MNIITLILFFVYAYGLGFALTFFLNNSKNFLERNLIRVGIGLGVFTVLGVLMNLLRIPLDWKLFLILSLICPSYALIKKIKSKEFTKPFKLKLTKSNLNILIVFIIFLTCLYMYAGGALRYPYLEDDDPWWHAEGVKYVALEKTVFQPPHYNIQYIDPYPPGYDLLMGVLHQTSTSISWTLKFFNALIISLSILFFYFFAKIFTNSRNKALFATFILAALPSYFTHFIWAHSLTIMLLFPSLYCLEMIKSDKRWIYPAIIVISSIFLTHSSQAIKIGMMLGIYWAIKAAIEKNLLKNILIAGTGGFLLSFVWWFNKWKPIFSQVSTDSSLTTASTSFFTKLQSAFSPTAGTATRAYAFSDFFIAKPFGGINIHVGWGIFITLLLVLGLICCAIRYKSLLKKENTWVAVTLIWFIFTFLGTNSMTFNLPVGLIAFRFWLLMAIPVALLSSIGLWSLLSFTKTFKIPKIIVIIVIVLGILFTSGYQKYHHNTLPTWPPGVHWSSNEEIQGYIWLKTLPTDTKILGFCSDISSRHIIGFDKLDEPWLLSTINFKEKAINKTPSEITSFLKRINYDYMIIDSSCVKNFGINATNNKIQEIIESNQFKIAHQTQGMLLFKLV